MRWVWGLPFRRTQRTRTADKFGFELHDHASIAQFVKWFTSKVPSHLQNSRLQAL